MKECPGCGEAVPADFEKCPSCGERMEGTAPPPADRLPNPVPEESASEPVSASPPPAPPGVICPECGRTSPAEAQFCIYCRYAFGEEKADSTRKKRLLILAGVGAVLVIAVVAVLFLGGFIGEKPLDPAPTVAAKAGAAALASPAPNLSRPDTTASTSTLLPSAARADNSTPGGTLTPVSNTTLSRYIQNAGGSGDGGDGAVVSRGGHLGSGLYSSVRGRTPTITPIPTTSWRPVTLPTVEPSTDGYGYATGPLSWAGWGNWSPGYVHLTQGAASVVIASSGTTAVILVDETGTQLGLAAFSPPGGRFGIAVPEDSDYVLAIGAGNVTDTWTVSILTATPTVASSPSQAAGQPTQQTETRTFSGNGGGSMPGINLSPGTVSVQLSADQMTMAYLKDSSGTTLSTTVAGPNPGGSTTTLTKADQYHLEVWGTGTWSATVTWTGVATATSTAITTVATTSPLTTTPTTVVTTAPTATPTSTPITTATTAGQQSLSWSGTGAHATPFFDLSAGIYQIGVESDGLVNLYLLDSMGEHIGGSLTFEDGGTRSIDIEKPGSYILDIQGNENPWRVSIGPMSTA